MSEFHNLSCLQKLLRCQKSCLKTFPINFGQKIIWRVSTCCVVYIHAQIESINDTNIVLWLSLPWAISCDDHVEWIFLSLCTMLNTLATDTQHSKTINLVLWVFRLLRWQTTPLLVCEPIVEQCGNLETRLKTPFLDPQAYPLSLTGALKGARKRNPYFNWTWRNSQNAGQMLLVWP